MNSIVDKIDGENVRIDDFIDCTYIYIYNYKTLKQLIL